MTWQPISTAPLDKEILLFRNGRVTIGEWDLDEYVKKPKPFWRTRDTIILGRIDARKNPPTHWMELPEPPT